MSNDRGFVVIDILMEVVAVTGLLSMIGVAGVQMAIAMTSISGARDEARFEAMRSDLEDLRARQAIYYADELSYSNSAADLRFSTSPGVTVHIVASPEGWAATATHAAHDDDRGCSIYFGHVRAPERSATPEQPGEIACATG